MTSFKVLPDITGKCVWTFFTLVRITSMIKANLYHPDLIFQL